MKTYTIKDFEKQFPTDDSCLEYIFQNRYPNGVFCEKCGKVTKHYKRQGMKFYACEYCGMGVAPTSGTIFHKSDTPLKSWFHAIFLLSSTKTGISAKQLQRELGVTYKTAWRMFKQIRTLMSEDITGLDGVVEVDETYIGGRSKGKRGRGASGKTIVMGMVDRDGSAIAKIIPDVKASTLLPMIENCVAKDGKTVIYTDELQATTILRNLVTVMKSYNTLASNTLTESFTSTQRKLFGLPSSVESTALITQLVLFTFRAILILICIVITIGRMRIRCS